MGEQKPTIILVPEGPFTQLLGNSIPNYHTTEGTMGPNSLMVVYVNPLPEAPNHVNVPHIGETMSEGGVGGHRGESGPLNRHRKQACFIEKQVVS